MQMQAGNCWLQGCICYLEARDSSSAFVRPMCGTPPKIAMVAGVAPCWRTTSSTALAVSRFCRGDIAGITGVVNEPKTGLGRGASSKVACTSCAECKTDLQGYHYTAKVDVLESSHPESTVSSSPMQG